MALKVKFGAIVLNVSLLSTGIQDWFLYACCGIRVFVYRSQGGEVHDSCAKFIMTRGYGKH